MEQAPAVLDIEIRLLLEAVYLRYQYDFREYARASLRRRLTQAQERLGCRSLSELQERVLREPEAFQRLLPYLTVQVSEMYRDPGFFLALRQRVAPWLATYPSIRAWVAGCATGEEVYSLAILLAEEGLFDRTTIYATDISPQALQRAEAGIYEVDRVRQFSDGYRAAGGKHSLSDYYTAAYGAAVFDQSLKRHLVFSDHSLATDQVFAEVQLVLCRNVLIYFRHALRDRAVGLFTDALCHKGFLGLGSRETLRFTAHERDFVPWVSEHRIYQRT